MQVSSAIFGMTEGRNRDQSNAPLQALARDWLKVSVTSGHLRMTMTRLTAHAGPIRKLRVFSPNCDMI